LAAPAPGAASSPASCPGTASSPAAAARAAARCSPASSSASTLTASCSSSLIIWISWAARNGSPTMSPRIQRAPPPIPRSPPADPLVSPEGGSPRPAQGLVVGPGDQVLGGDDGQAENRVPDHLGPGYPQRHQVRVFPGHRVDPQQGPEEDRAGHQQREVGQL